MKGKRRQHSAQFKSRVAVAAIRGVMTVQEIASKYEVHPTQVAKWKKAALDSLPTAFSGGQGKRDKNEEQLRKELYEQIGRLKVENDWLKKKGDLFE